MFVTTTFIDRNTNAFLMIYPIKVFIVVNDCSLVLQALGKLNPQAAFMRGKLKIKGNIMLTQKLKSVIASESKL